MHGSCWFASLWCPLPSAPCVDIPAPPPSPAKRYAKAVAGYTAALAADPTSAVLHANRSAAHARLENFGSALADASRAVELDPAYVKAYYRRADAAAGLGRVKEALKDYRAAAKVAPRDPDLRKKLAAAEREVTRLRFEEAIAVPDEDAIPVADRVDLDTMPVDAAYDGPRMDPHPSLPDRHAVTLPFVLAMIDAFKASKHIHRRYAFEIVLAALDVAGHPMLAVKKIGLTWPIDADGIRDFARGKRLLIVVEEKRSFVEAQIREALYNMRADQRPDIVGKTDLAGAKLFPATMELSPEIVGGGFSKLLREAGLNVGAPPALAGARDRGAGLPRHRGIGMERHPHPLPPPCGRGGGAAGVTARRGAEPR